MATASSTLKPLVNSTVDGLTNGTYWVLGPDRTLTWAVANGQPGDWAWSAFGANVMSQAMTGALNAYAEVANIHFAYRGWYDNVTTAPADLVISATLYPAAYGMTSRTYARAYFPNEAMSDGEIARLYGSSAAYPNASGDLVLNYTNNEMAYSQYNPGSNGFFAVLHELGHALGLKHPHDNGGTVGHPTFSQLGISPADTQRLTIMSYDPATDLAAWFQAFGLPTSVGYPQSLMPLDVLALQSIYGPNTTTRAGDTLYSLYNDNVIATYWDASGRDALTAQDSQFGWHIEWILDVSGSSITLATPYDWTGNTGKWYFNVEDFVGSNSADSIGGSNADNVIYGLGGSDFLVGRAGNDYIDGGAGIDSSNYLGVRSSFAISHATRGWTVGDRRGQEGTDTVIDVERLHFSDLSVALDTDVVGHAGQSAQILRAIFGPAALRDPTIVGIGIRLLDDGIAYDALVGLAVDAMRSVGGFTSNADFVRLVYHNVVGIEPPPADLAYFTSLLDTRQLSQSQLGIVAATASVNVLSADLVGIASAGIDFIPYHG